MRPRTSLSPNNLRLPPLSIGLTLVTFLCTAAWTAFAASTHAATPAGIDDPSGYTLVFSDDFSTDPNTNGLWTIHRYSDDADNEAWWSPKGRNWSLTKPEAYKAAAVFANYDLTATEWKAVFDYRVGKLGGFDDGGDGFCFMFYKDKAAYGTPGYGQFMGFQLSQPDIISVKGYGLKFDNYYNIECDPTENSYIALIEDNVCNSRIFVEDARTGDGLWHTIAFTYSNGDMRVNIDNQTVWTATLAEPDYSFSGIGFGAGTGSAIADHEIDNFRLWVKSE